MSSKIRSNRIGIDWLLLSVFFAIILVGWLMLYTVSYEGDGGLWWSFDSIVGQQTIWVGVALVAFIIFYSLDWRIWNTLAYPIYILTILSLIGVLIFLQPDAGTAIIFLSFLVPMYRAGLNPIIYIIGFSLAFIFIGSLLWSPYLMILLILLACYFVLAYGVKDNRLPLSLLVMLALFVAAGYSFFSYAHILGLVLLGGLYFFYLPYKEARYKAMISTLLVGLVCGGLSIGTTWAFDNILKPHQRDRINVWLKPELSDRHGSLYNIIQQSVREGFLEKVFWMVR